MTWLICTSKGAAQPTRSSKAMVETWGSEEGYVEGSLTAVTVRAMEIHWEGQRRTGRMSGPGDRQDLGIAEGEGSPLAGPLQPQGRSLGCVGHRGLPGRRPMSPMAVDMSVFRYIPGGVTPHFPLSGSSAYSGGGGPPFPSP